MKKILSILFAFSLISSVVFAKGEEKTTDQAAEAPKPVLKGKSFVLDTFEAGNYWDAVRKTRRDGDLSIDACLDNSWKSEGTYSLKCTFKKGEAEDSKSGFLTSSPIQPNLLGAKKIIFDVNNTNDYALTFSIVFITGAKWDVTNQSETVTCEPGVHQIEFTISEFQNLEKVNQIILYVNGITETSGSFNIDNCRLSL